MSSSPLSLAAMNPFVAAYQRGLEQLQKVAFAVPSVPVRNPADAIDQGMVDFIQAQAGGFLARSMVGSPFAFAHLNAALGAQAAWNFYKLAGLADGQVSPPNASSISGT